MLIDLDCPVFCDPMWVLRPGDQIGSRVQTSGTLDVPRIQLIQLKQQLQGDGVNLRKLLPLLIRAEVQVIPDVVMDRLLQQRSRIPRAWMDRCIPFLGSIYRRQDADHFLARHSRRPDDDLYVRNLVVTTRSVSWRGLSVYTKLDKSFFISTFQYSQASMFQKS